MVIHRLRLGWQKAIIQDATWSANLCSRCATLHDSFERLNSFFSQRLPDQPPIPEQGDEDEEEKEAYNEDVESEESEQDEKAKSTSASVEPGS